MNRVLVNLCLVSLHMSASLVRASPFIDGESLHDTSTSDYDMPPSCTTKNYCFDEGYKYPQFKVQQVLKQLPFLTFDNRMGTHLTFRNSENDNSECPTVDTFNNKPIYYIRDENNKVRVVMQVPEIFEQIYSVRWCKRPGLITYNTPNFLNGSHFLQAKKVECVETYMDFEFLVLAPGDKVEMVKAKGGIPVCCNCRYPNPN
ncbi:hypothetical protein PYW07_001485 [Mythimna separata]|uniref:Spaetzle domain-containing protein n=1 Tax=Mythimna separata TaxID=271217 RepID=A0AAD7YT98_MYTSE|nr:hypothetical protein PYW07_001485 [Mythimna separata]